MKKICFWFLALCPVILCAGESFFEDGNTVWAVDTENSAHETIRYAERELKNALFKISGVKFPSSGTAEHRIVLKVDPAMPADRISIRTRDGKLLLSGGSERSVLYAVYTFLQKYLGVRWLWPGASGEFMPRKERWTLPEIDFSYQPPIKYRALHQTGDAPADKEGFRDWMARNFSTNHWNGVKNDRKDRARGFYVAWGAHAACVPQRYFRQHPEYFALTNGIRHNMQFCFSNPDAIKLAAKEIAGELRLRKPEIVMLFPSDNHQLCECSSCSVMKGSDKWFRCFDSLVKILKKRFPKVEFLSCAYMGFMDPPSRLPQDSPFTILTTYRRCNLHKLDSDCPHNQREAAWIREWANKGTPIGFYNYEFCIFHWKEGLLTPFYSLIDENLKMAARLKSPLVTTEVWQGGPKQALRDVAYMKNRLAVYLYAQLMWNPSADCDALIRDWCQTVYGKGADPLYRYFKRIDKQWTSMKIHCGIGEFPSRFADSFVTPELYAEVRSLFLEADRLNGGKTDAVEYEKYLFGQWMRIAPPKPGTILSRVKDGTSPGNRIGPLPVRAAWNEKNLFFHGVELPFEAEITPLFAEKPFRFSVDGNGKRSSSPASPAQWSWNKTSVSIPVSIFNALPEPGFYWGLRIRSGGQAWPADKNSPGSMIFFNREQEDRTILWSKGESRYDKAMAKQFAEMGWNFDFATREQMESGNHSVYVFCTDKCEGGFAPEMWPKIWEKVRNGAMLVIQPLRLDFKKITDDETLLFRIHGIGKTLLSDRKPEYLRGDWLKNPFNLQREFNLCITPAYTAVPQRPDAWQILANQPKSSREKKTREPFILFRPYGKGFVVVFCTLNYGAFSPAVLIGNLYENREALRGKSL